LRRAEAIWTELGSSRVHYALGNLAAVQHLRGQRTQAISLFQAAARVSQDLGDAQGAAAALVGLARALEPERPDEAAAVIEQAIAVGQAIWMPHAYGVAASIALRRCDRQAAARWVDAAIAAANNRRDRPALAEALLVQAALADPPTRAVAEESARLWRELGSPIGWARADLLVAESSTGRQREELIADAERTLFDAGALGVLHEARQRRRETSARIAIYTLGGFRLVRDGHVVDSGEWGSKKARDLVKLLVARRGAPVVRDEAVDVLWPDDADRSTRRLSVLLSTVRSVFDPDKSHPPEHYINADHDTIWLVREHVDIDVDQFLADAAEARRLAAAGDKERAFDRYTSAATRYVGDFCADDPYADWLAGIRELARNTFVDTSFELAQLADAAGAHNEAIRHWLRCLDVDPYDEDAHLGMVRSLLAQRRHGDARRAYRTYCARVAELDVEPAPYPM
jgi:DNA-binding SARP family transcriptional activator